MRQSHLHSTRVTIAGIALLSVASACNPGAGTPPETATPSATASSDGPATVTGSAPPGAIVTLHAADTGPAPYPEGPAVMDQYSRQFVPDLLFVRVGQVVEFRNSEDVDHNVQVLRQPTGTTVLNESGSKGQVFKHVFDQPGWFDVVCDVHPGMRGTIVATTTPFAAWAGQDGAFTMSNVPQGKYVLKTLANGRETSRDISVNSPRITVTAR